jgi:hypothetical protein
MEKRLFSEKVYKLSETETVTLTDTWEADVQAVFITVNIINNKLSDDLYRVIFVNRLRRYWYFSDYILANNWIRAHLGKHELEDKDRFSDVDVYIMKNDRLIKKIIYKTPHISELENRFSDNTHEFDGEYIFNNINKEPIFICGAPGGGTSYITKMLRYCGLFIGDDVCRFEDRKTFESTAITLLQWYFVRQIIREKLYKDVDRNINNIFQLIFESKITREWLILDKSDIVNSDDFDLFKKEFVKVLPLFWGDNKLDLKWGFKKPFNMIWIEYLIEIFPNAKVLIVDKKKKSNTENRSFEGKYFEKMNEFQYKLFTEIGNDLKYNNRKCDFDKMNTDIDYFNEVMDWCGLLTKTKEEHYQMLVDLKYDGVESEN